MLGLRTMAGVDTSTLPSSLSTPMLRRARKWIEAGDLHLRNSVLTIDPASWLITDSILADLFAD